MPLVSITRLRLRSYRFIPAFLIHSLRSTRQVRRSPGFLGGWLGAEAGGAFWTATVWDSLDSMRAYRNSGAHLAAMKKLLTWCDEASYAHWEAPGGVEPPDAQVALERLRRQGHPSKVLHPSERQEAGETAGDLPPRIGRRLGPAAA